jgi:hypothetical protein
LQRAEDSLAEFFDVCERYPDARKQVIALIGERGWRELEQAQDAVRRRAAELAAQPRAGEDSSVDGTPL